MKSYKLLIIAWYAYIGHVSEFIRNLKKINPNVEISLLTSKARLEDIPEDIQEQVSEIVRFQYYSGKCKIKLIRDLVDRFFFMRTFIRLSKCRYDVVNIHFARPRLYFALPWIKKLSSHIVISPWGSDVLRVVGKKNINRLQSVYSMAEFVSIGQDTAVGKKLINEFGVDARRLVGLRWGGEFFDYIRENSIAVTTEDAKSRFGLNGRYVITCGYNTQKEQRHEAIIEAIYSIKDHLPSNLTLLFPFTYGRNEWTDRYTDSIKEKAKDLGFDVVSVEENLNMSDLLKLRMATDIFVHVQTTDSGSRCVMEYVACNKKIVHGSWIKYPYLEDYRPSCYFPVDRLENLGETIIKAYNSDVTSLPKEVVDIIIERGWHYKMTFWNAFFESLSS